MSFLMTNREKDIRKQPAFFATLSKLKSGLCSCGQADDWDREAASCSFHDQLHTLSDLTWALSTLMEQEAVIPLSASAIGAAGLQLVMKVQELAEKEKVKSAQATGDASSSSDTRTSKAQDPQPKKDRNHVDIGAVILTLMFPDAPWRYLVLFVHQCCFGCGSVGCLLRGFGR